MQGNLISNDPLVAAVFHAVNSIEAEPIDRLMAVQRAGNIAGAYLHPHASAETRRVAESAFSVPTSSPSER